MGRVCLKFYLCLTCVMSSLAAPAQQTLTLDLIDLAAISRMSPQQLEALAEGLAMQEIMRTKRSSAQALTSAVSKASASALQSKVGFLGQASSGALSYAASASSKSGYDEHHGYNYEPQESKVDFWGLKKSILYTLFQAVKAITGGVTILKGQLIKGGGALAAKLGTAISGKGDLVSNFGKKIVKSAALSEKKHHAPVYGPPAPAHVDYIPSSYGAPTAPAHYHSAPSAPTGYGPAKYTSHLDGRGKLSGVHAGLVILTPLGHGEEASDTHYAQTTDPGHTPLEPPPSLLHSAFSAIKSVFSSAAPSSSYQTTQDYEHPPPLQPSPPFQQHVWGAVNSYGEPAATETYPPDYRRNAIPIHSHHVSKVHSGLTADKLQKISDNLDKIAHLQLQRSSEELPRFDGLDVYRKMLMKGMKTPLLPTPVVTDAELGEIPADLQPAETTVTIQISSTPTTTAKGETGDDKTRRRKDVKFILKGNKIVQV